MKAKSRWVAVSILVCILAVNASGAVLDTEGIDRVHRKAFADKDVLEERDFAVIEAFLSAALEEMLLVDDFSELVSIRREITSRKGDSEPSQYSAKFISSVHKQLETVLLKVKGWEAGRGKTRLERNLVILIAELKNMDLIPLSVSMLRHDNGTVRYWAVKSMANSGVAGYLNAEATRDAVLEREIVGELEKIVPGETQTEILDLIVRFAGRLNGSEAKQLVSGIADLRMRSYEKWTVKYELMDATVLKSLGSQILSGGSELDKAAMGRKFGQLYSYVMQRYISGKDVLSEASLGQLVSVMVEVEDTILGKLLGQEQEQKTIKKAIEKQNLTTLEREYDYLLGGGGQLGQLPSKLNFDYGKDAGGRAITVPKELPGPPKAVVEATETEADAEGK